MKLPHKAGPDIVYELAVNLYPSSVDSFREAVSNALDEGSKKVSIQTSPKQVVVEDWGEGIRDIDKFVEFGQYAKAKLGGEIIGMKGLGKLSLLRLGDAVNFRTNNGEFTINLMMTPQENEYEIGGVTKYLDHQGTKIIIDNPREVPPTDELATYLRRAFGLRIAKGTEVYLNGVKLESRIDPDEHLLCRLNGAIDITGNLKADKKLRGSVDAYIKHVYVTSVLLDPERNFGGWVNCNSLIPTTDRNDIKRDTTYSQFVEHLKEYVAGKFPRREEDISKEEVLLGNEIANLLRRYLSHEDLIPKGLLPVGKGKEVVKDANPSHERKAKTEKEEKEEGETEYEKQHTSRKTDKPIRRVVKSTYGIRYVDQDAGNDREPLFYVEPNLVIKNRTNDLYKFALKSKASLGPKWLRMLPYLSRVAVSINPQSKKWTREQFNLEADRASRYFLQIKDELTG